MSSSACRRSSTARRTSSSAGWPARGCRSTTRCTRRRPRATRRRTRPTTSTASTRRTSSRSSPRSPTRSPCIRGIDPVDFRYARELGYTIKLIAHTQRHAGRVEARVHPAMLPLDHPLARVEGANNAVFVEGDLVGQVLLVGEGAGGKPTASAVVGDLIDLARGIRRGVQSRPSFQFDDRIGVIPMADVVTRAYYRMQVEDRAGVLAAVGQVFAEEGVSISSFIQKDASVEDRTAEFVITTHPTADAHLQKARQRVAGLQPVREVSCFLRAF